jgi:hypothetical protein
VQTLSEARERRADMLLDELLDRELTYMFADTIAKDPAATAKAVGPLKNLLKYYAKFPHPFTKCVRDNRKRFPAPGQVERICARLVDILKGTTKWRHGGGRKANLSDDISLDDVVPVITDDVVALLDSMSPLEQSKLESIYMEAVEVVHS